MVDYDALWREFPGTLPEFEAAFPDDDACREFLIEMRWGGVPECPRCGHGIVWWLSNGRFECAECGHQTSVTAGTPLHGTRKPLKLWFRAIWEMLARKNGISAKDLQRLMGFGSYRTAWLWLHKLRRCLVAPDRRPLEGEIQLDEGFLGGVTNRPGRPRGEDKELVIVAVERGGRVRLEYAPGLTGETVREFVGRNVAVKTTVTTDGYRSYSAKSLSPQTHDRQIQKKTKKRAGGWLASDPVLGCHLVLSLLKRWWIGTHHGAIREKYCQAYLDEFEFRHNRRNTKGSGRLMARALQNLVQLPHVTEVQIRQSVPFPRFALT